jgi:hypothetical protein
LSDSEFRSVGNKENHAVDAQGKPMLQLTELFNTELFIRELFNTELFIRELFNTELLNRELFNREPSNTEWPNNKLAAFRKTTWHYY